MSNKFDIENIISKLQNKRPVFVSEADLQFEMALIIKDEFPNAKIRLEYCPSFNPNMHIDILVIIDNKWIPIEIKYKTKGGKNCSKQIENEIFNLKNHGAKDVNSYLYLKDIHRIEDIQEHESKFFQKGYTVFITNDLTYMKKPTKKNCYYREFSLEDGIIKSGVLKWDSKASDGTKKNCEDPIKLKGKYPIKWKLYKNIDDTSTGTFIYLVNRIGE